MNRNRILEQKINYDLKKQYGTENDLQRFRIVWADDEFEYRRCEYSESGVAYTIPKIEYRHKYPFSGYLLEKTNFFPKNNSDIKTHNGYECIYHLPEDKELSERAVKLLVHWAETATLPSNRKPEYTDEHEAEERKKDFEKEVAFFEDYFRQKDDNLGLNYGEAISYANLDAKEALKNG